MPAWPVTCKQNPHHKSLTSFYSRQSQPGKSRGNLTMSLFPKHRLLYHFGAMTFCFLCQQQRLYQRAKRLDLQPATPPLTPTPPFSGSKPAPPTYSTSMQRAKLAQAPLSSISSIISFSSKPPGWSFRLNSYVVLGIF